MSHSYEEHESHSCDHLSDVQPKFVRKLHNLVLVYPYSIITGTGIGVRVKPKKWDKSSTTALFEELSVFDIESNTYALKNKKINS